MEEKRKINKYSGGGLKDGEIVLDMSRRILAHTMMVSARDIPHVCFEYEPDVTDFVEYFSKFKKENDIKVSFNTLMLKCITEGMKESPILNSHLYYKPRSAKGTIRTFEKIAINMPTILQDGTMQSLTIQDAGAGSLTDLDNKIKTLLEKSQDEIRFGQAQYALAYEQTIGYLKKGKIRSFFSRVWGANFGKERIKMHGSNNTLQFLAMSRKYNKAHKTDDPITKDDLREGTVVVSNVGSIKKDLKGRVSLFEIIPPQVFAVMLGNLQRKPVVINDEEGERVEIRTVLPITLAFDHRACDFGDLIPFIEKMDEIFARPEIMENWK